MRVGETLIVYLTRSPFNHALVEMHVLTVSQCARQVEQSPDNLRTACRVRGEAEARHRLPQYIRRAIKYLESCDPLPFFIDIVLDHGGDEGPR